MMHIKADLGKKLRCIKVPNKIKDETSLGSTNPGTRDERPTPNNKHLCGHRGGRQTR